MSEKERVIRLVCFVLFSAMVLGAGFYLIAGKIKQTETNNQTKVIRYEQRV